MKRPPIPRPTAYDLYWQFASKRQSVFERRIAGEAWPWTDDPIVQSYKFCNVFRASDRVSQYMIRDVCYAQDAGSPQDLVFQIAAFRTFSRIETWESVRQFLGRAPRIVDLEDGSFTEALESAKRINGGLYTGAFILCATNAYGKQFKHLNHVELFRHMFLHEHLADSILEASSLEDTYWLLRAFPLMGDFMSYQIAIDLNYSALLNFSEDDFTKPGPGAMRGIKKCFVSLGDYTPEEVIHWMVERQEFEFNRLGLPFAGLWGRRLHAIDCQNLFCETDKYCREAMPELASGRTRIKARYAQSTSGLRLFYPPKWGVNARLPKEPVLTEPNAVEIMPRATQLLLRI